ncbi:cytochrome c biogenesis heme-transporting ATPase CcmA [Limnohabitans sp. 63ED37-2]|uniref:cytochrome c biogenesis heme-transporting ATPase CcmA n=1 Tax=Limnohabitans sp. 63ED37-2 TaxID=1678128 RepID=UPI000706758D|nr:cytochrome c biogenesis heme-transporting ATPase CcmA [Limnohabitans sp. 63ED37-2]ALK87901.1 Cytochrome c biogenesis ATP-binding export protein CcmA [Limnohabitans sp. 63ED37-2]
MASWVLTAMDLACQKAQRTLFEGVSFSVPAGSWLHIEGGNGCGKTSLLRILCGLSPAARGQVLWPSSSPSSSSSQTSLSRPDRSVLHYIGHALGLKPDLTACENLCADAQVSGLALGREQAVQALAAQGLQSRAHLPVRVLSQGQRQGVALARLRTSPARLWVLDEPLVGLDTQATATARALLQSHVDAGGAVVMTSHHDVGLQGPGARLHLGREVGRA